VKRPKDFWVSSNLNLEMGLNAPPSDLEDPLSTLRRVRLRKGARVSRAVISYLDANDRIRVFIRRLARQEEREALEKLNREQDDSMTLGDILKLQLNRRNRISTNYA